MCYSNLKKLGPIKSKIWQDPQKVGTHKSGKGIISGLQQEAKGSGKELFFIPLDGKPRSTTVSIFLFIGDKEPPTPRG